MKKQYVTPNIQVVSVNNATLLTASTRIYEDERNESSRSRFNNVDFIDDDEEY